MRLFRILFVSLALLSNAAPAKADIFAVAGSDLSSDFGAGVGGGLGYTYPFTDIIGLRFDLTYLRYTFQGKNTFGNSNITYSRIPLFAGVRGGMNIDKNARFYLEGGLEISHDKMDIKGDYGGETFGAKSGKTSMGAAVGGAVQFGITDFFALGLIFRNHSSSPGYFTYGLSLSGGF
jgi:hypothetical protein